MQLLYVFKTHWFISNVKDLLHLQTRQMIQIHLLNTCINYDWSKAGSEDGLMGIVSLCPA